MLSVTRIFLFSFALTTMHHVSAMEKDLSKKRKLEETHQDSTTAKKQSVELPTAWQEIKIELINDLNKNKLHLAALDGNLEELKKIHESNQELFNQALNSQVLERLITPLMCAVAANNKGCIEFLIQKGANTNVTTLNGNNAMHIAVQNGLLAAVQILHQKNPNLTNSQNLKNLRTPLYSAVYYNKPEIIMWLLENGANINSTLENDYHVMHIAAEEGHLESLILLCKKAPQLINKPDSECWTPLHIAALHNKPKAITLLLKNGADIHALLENGCGAMHIAAEEGHLESLNVLCKKAPELINTPDSEGWTPLHIAALYNKPEAIAWLLQNGADIHALLENGSSAMYLAAQKGHLESLRVLFIKAHELINKPNSEGWTPLHSAAFNNKPEVVTWLFKVGADIKTLDNKGNNALHRAIMGNALDSAKTLITLYDEGIQLLIENNMISEAKALQSCKLTVHDKQQNTLLHYSPIHYATSHGNPQTIEWLLSEGAHIDARAHNNQTPLHLAAQFGKNTFIDCTLNWIRNIGLGLHISPIINFLPHDFKRTPTCPLSVKEEIKNALLIFFMWKKRMIKERTTLIDKKQKALAWTISNLPKPLIFMIAQALYNPEECISYLLELKNADNKTPFEVATNEKCKELLTLKNTKK